MLSGFCYAASLCLLSLATPAVSQTLPSLLEALKANDASDFAAALQADSALFATFTSGRVQTVFAPLDLVAHGARKLKTRQSGPDLGLSGCIDLMNLGDASNEEPGQDLPTVSTSPLLDNQPQRLVTDTRPANTTNPTKRSLDPRHPHPSLLRIASGLGNITNIIKGDIPWTGGLLHITDSYFTSPQSLSSTAKATGQTGTFVELAAQNNLTESLDNTPTITAFLPSDAAFASSNSTVPAASLLANHIVDGVMYLPDLTDGTVLTTTSGGTLRINVRNGIFFVNGARITQANLILANGVAHILDKVLAPQQAPPPVTGGGSHITNALSLGGIVAAAGAVAMMVFA